MLFETRTFPCDTMDANSIKHVSGISRNETVKALVASPPERPSALFQPPVFIPIDQVVSSIVMQGILLIG